MIRNKNYILRTVAGKSVLLPTGAAAFDFSGMISVNETAAFIWEKLENDVTVQELAELLCGEYDVDKETAVSDVEEIVKSLDEAGLLQK